MKSDQINQRDSKQPQFQEVFAGLPEAPSHRLDALAEVNKSFRKAMADQLRPVVRTLLQDNPPPDDKGKQELAQRLNHILHDVGLAIVDPSTGQPASVVAQPYRFRLQTRAAPTGGKRTRSGNTESLAPLELIECVRTEPFIAWQRRIRDSNPPPGAADEKPGRE